MKLVLIKGAPLELMRQYDIPFYFDQAGKLSQYFEFIGRVKFNLSSEGGTDYLKKVVEKSNNLEGTYGYGN